MNITKTVNGDQLNIALEGRLDTGTAPELEKVLNESLDQIKSLTIDMAGLEYISSAGLRTLLSAKKALDECNLYAPFSGRIANLEARPFQHNDKICTLIDDSQFEVEFRILEAELSSVKKGQKIKVSPFISDSLTFEGVVTEINPLVDDKGLIKVMARLDNKDNALIDGMNVRIIIEEQVSNMFVVPKDAVVERDGYHVIFIYKDGQAVWTYVDVLHSNISSFAITGCQRKETSIHEGDIVITSGNLNLADGTEVKINNKE